MKWPWTIFNLCLFLFHCLSCCLYLIPFQPYQKFLSCHFSTSVLHCYTRLSIAMTTSNYQTAMVNLYCLCVLLHCVLPVTKLYSAFLLSFLFAFPTNNQVSLNMTLSRQYVGGRFEGEKKMNMTDSYLCILVCLVCKKK